MKWTKDKQYMTNAYVLSKFPFFDVEISGPDYGPWKLGYMFGYDHTPFINLDDAKKHVIKELYKVLSKVDFTKVKTIEELGKLNFVRVSYSDWRNNTGDGKYIHNDIWKQYHWIEGRFLNTTRTCHNYAIRYDIGVNDHYVKQHAVMVVKRHIKRFLKQYEND